MKTTLKLKPVNGGPFNCLPARDIELEDDRILCNDVVLPFERHPHGVKLYVIGNEYGALGAVWASHDQDAFDELVNSGLGDGLLIEEKDANEECAHLGNAGEPANLDYAWIQEADLSGDLKLCCRFAEARGGSQDTLDK